MEVSPDDVLRRQQEHEQEGQVRASVADKLDKWLFNEQSQPALGCNQVCHGQHREKQSNGDTGQEFHCPVFPPPSWEAIVPKCCEQLLAVWLSNKLGGKKKGRLLLTGTPRTLPLTYVLEPTQTLRLCLGPVMGWKSIFWR